MAILNYLFSGDGKEGDDNELFCVAEHSTYVLIGNNLLSLRLDRCCELLRDESSAAFAELILSSFM